MEYLGQERREGLGRKANSRFILLLLLLVSVLLLLSGLYTAQASVFKKAREGVIDAASPLLEVFSGPIAYFNDLTGSVSDYFNVLEQNKALRQENAELRQWMEEALELREVVASFKGLQSYEAPPEAQPIDAYVIGESNDAFARSMIVNAGRTRNVESGQAVVDDNGLVGRVVDTGSRASRVLLLTDIQSRVPVYVEGADIEGIMVGKTSSNPTISITESTLPSEIVPGQRVLTSGAGGVMPRGLPVGVVGGENNEGIDVDLYANYVQTRMVRIINFEFTGVVSTGDDEAVELIQDDSETEAAATPAVEESAIEGTVIEEVVSDDAAVNEVVAAPAQDAPLQGNAAPDANNTTPASAPDALPANAVAEVVDDAATAQPAPALSLPAADESTDAIDQGSAVEVDDLTTNDPIEPTEG